MNAPGGSLRSVAPNHGTTATLTLPLGAVERDSSGPPFEGDFRKAGTPGAKRAIRRNERRCALG
jgi:hypothetical protein